jgi:exonuclease SbcD
VTTIYRPEVVVVRTSKGADVQIAGMPHLSKSFALSRTEAQGKSPDELRNALEQRYGDYIADLAEKCDRSLPTILLGHFWVRNSVVSQAASSYLSIAEPQVGLSSVALAESFDYVALGHIHRHQSLNALGAPPVVYSGSIDRVDFGERDEQKGYVLVDLQRGGAQWRFVPVPAARPMLEVEVDAEGDAPTEAILSALRRHDLTNAIVRLTYRVSAERLPLIREADIRSALEAAFYVAGIRRDVRQDPRSRTRLLTESLDPATALTHYLTHIGKSEERRDELVRYADRLMQQLHQEEAVA